MPRPRKALPGGNSNAREATSVTIPRNLLKWGIDYAEQDGRNFSSLVVHLLAERRKQVEGEKPVKHVAAEAPDVSDAIANSGKNAAPRKKDRRKPSRESETH